MPLPPPHTPLACRIRRTGLRLNVAALLMLATLLFGMVQFLSLRHYSRFNWSRAPQARLSEKTRRILEAAEGEVRVFVVMRPAHEAFPATLALLREYAAAHDRFLVHPIDPDRDMANAELIARHYRLDGEEAVVFDIAGRHRVVPAAHLVEYGYPEGRDAPPRRAFLGEPLFTSAIHALTQSVRPAAFFVQGHGERSPLDFDRRAGYSRIAARLRDENLDVDLLNLAEARAIPPHCALLVIAGPRREFTPFESALVRDYLDRKGRLLLLLDARTRTGLEPLLRNWGVLVGDDIVVDPARTLSGRDLHISAYPDHPVTRSLQGLATVFSVPRSVRPRETGGGGDKPLITPLASCSDSGWAEFDPVQTTPRFDAQIDIPGPVPVAVAVERGPVPGVHVQIRPTRLVVFGDSAFASNGGLMGANADLFLNAANWLLERGDLLAISPRAIEDLRFVLTARQLRCLFVLACGILPGLVAAAGLFIHWKRRG